MRFFIVPPECFRDGQVWLEGEQARHLATVLRLPPDSAVALGDGEGHRWRAVLREVGPALVVAELQEEMPAEGEPPVWLALGQGLAKGEKMDLVVEKGTELGVSLFLPLQAARSVARLSGERALERRQRWERVAAAAARQCGRAVLPRVEAPLSLADALAALPEDTLVLMPWEGERRRGLRQALAGREAGRVALLVGPEGGWEEAEVDLAAGRGALTVSLGPRILRTETAGIAATAMVLYALGDLGGPSGV